MTEKLLKNFVVEIREGRPSFTSDYQRSMFNDFLKQFEGKKVWMTIDPKLPKRTDRQNRFYWLYLGIISRETGEDKDSLHAFFGDEFLTKGVKNLFGKEVKVKKSTTELNRIEFGNYLEEICRLTEIPIPDPSIYELAPLK